MSVETPSRRDWLQFMVTLLPMTAAGFWPRKATAASRHAQARSNLLQLVNHAEARWVGDALLTQLDHPTPAVLVLALTSRLALYANADLSGFCEIRTLQQAFHKAVSADFAEGRCLSVSGWVLTRTEVELCALAAQSADRA